jgi:hypothetical protein
MTFFVIFAIFLLFLDDPILIAHSKRVHFKVDHFVNGAVFDPQEGPWTASLEDYNFEPEKLRKIQHLEIPHKVHYVDRDLSFQLEELGLLKNLPNHAKTTFKFSRSADLV